MEDRKEGMNGGSWMSVPAFGEWEKSEGMVPDYSMDFSKIREHRKIHKSDFSRASLGNDDELLAAHHRRNEDRRSQDASDDPHRPAHRDHSPTVSAPPSFHLYRLFGLLVVIGRLGCVLAGGPIVGYVSCWPTGTRRRHTAVGKLGNSLSCCFN